MKDDRPECTLSIKPSDKLLMRHTLRTVFLLTVLFVVTGCQGPKGTLVDDAPRARATRSPGFQPRAHEKIAVLVRDNAERYYRRGTGTHRQVEDVFAQAAARKGYRLATRSQVEAIKQEIDFENNTIWTGRDPVEVGNLYNVSALLIVSIDESFVRDEASLASKIPEPDRRDGFLSELVGNVLDAAPRETYYAEAGISASLISVRNAEVLWRGSYTGAMKIEEGQPGTRAIPAVSEVVARALPTR